MLEHNKEAGARLARLAIGLPGVKSVTISETGRGLPQASFEAGGHSYALIYDPTRQSLEENALDGGYFPAQIADYLDEVLLTRRVLARSALMPGQNSHYEWCYPTSPKVEHPKTNPSEGRMIDRVRARIAELIVKS